MILPDQHISVSSGDDIRTICKPLFEKSDINFFIFCRFYDDGTLCSFPSNTIWHKHFMEKEYFSNKLRLKEGIHLWAAKEEFSTANIEARENFDIDNKFEIVERGKNYYDVYGFASKKGKNRIVDYYINNIDYLKKFVLYFKNRAKKIIELGNKLDNRIIIRHQIINCNMEKELEFIDDFMHNKIKYFFVNTKDSSDLYLTNREAQVLLYTLQQRNASEIAKKLNLSSKTVEGYLASAKDKLSCKTRAELFDKSFDSGLFQLIDSKDRE